MMENGLKRSIITQSSTLCKLGMQALGQCNLTVKGRVVWRTFYRYMHYKDLFGSIARVGYRNMVPGFYLVLHDLWWRKSTIMDLSINQHCQYRIYLHLHVIIWSHHQMIFHLLAFESNSLITYLARAHQQTWRWRCSCQAPWVCRWHYTSRLRCHDTQCQLYLVLQWTSWAHHNLRMPQNEEIQWYLPQRFQSIKH